MDNLLGDYTYDDRIRYDAHQLVYTSDAAPIVLTGIMGASLLAALLVDTPEGNARGIAVDSPAQRNDFFLRYEREVRRDNGGLFSTEVQALCQNYMELTGAEGALFTICGNDRLFDLAIGLTLDYMQRLVREHVYEHIYDACPWKMPFAQWLFDAGFVETRRQYLLSIDWTDEAAVYALNEQMNNEQSSITNNTNGSTEPTLVFAGLSAEQVLCGYWEWLWETAQQEAIIYPDGKVRLAHIKQLIRDNETDYDFLKPEMSHFTPEQLNLFRKWMTQWKDFVEKQIPPVVVQKTGIQQELFLDTCLPVPHENRYAEVREYIEERKKYDENFRKFCKAHKRTELCHQLSLMFGWVVSDNALGKSMRRKLRHPRKNYFQ